VSTGGGHPETHGRLEPTVGPSTPSGASSAHRYCHGQDLDLVCRQCGTSWRFGEDVPTQCPDCLDHLGDRCDMGCVGEPRPHGHELAPKEPTP